MTINEYLKQQLNLMEEEIKCILDKTTMRDVDLIKKRVEFYKRTFNLTDAELAKMIKAFPFLFNYDTISTGSTSVKSKIEFYKQTFNLTDHV